MAVRFIQPDEMDRKSTRLNSSHLVISYAVFCLKKKKKIHNLSQTSAYTSSGHESTVSFVPECVRLVGGRALATCLLYPFALCFSFFFFNDTATTEIYTLSLHDALPIYFVEVERHVRPSAVARRRVQ